MLHSRLPQLCQESSALYSICIAFQLALSSTVSSQFCKYFDTALWTFRSELECSTTLSDGTLTSGLLLCSIGVCNLNFLFRLSSGLSGTDLISADAWPALDYAFGRYAQNLAEPRPR